MAVVEASTVYRVCLASEQLVPEAAAWGAPPSHALLKPDQVRLNFRSKLGDFTDVWAGRYMSHRGPD